MGCGCMETSAWEDACRTWIHGDPGCGCRETPAWVWGADAVDTCMHGDRVRMQWMYGDSSILGMGCGCMETSGMRCGGCMETPGYGQVQNAWRLLGVWGVTYLHWLIRG